MRTVRSYHILTLQALLFLVANIFFVEAAAFQRKAKAEQKGVEILLEPDNKKASFSARKPVKFRIGLRNNFSSDQEGTIIYKVVNGKGEEVLTSSLDVRVNAKKTLVSSFEVNVDDEDTYSLTATIDLTEYNETFTRGFTYSGPPRKPKDRRENVPNPYIQNWTADNVRPGPPIAKQELVKEAEKENHEEATHADEGHGDEEGSDEEEGEIIVKVKPTQKDGIFMNGNAIKYGINIQNKYKRKQEGTFTLIVETEDGKELNKKQVKIKLGKRGQKSFNMTLPPISDPGIYNIKAALNTTTYDDTSLHAFGYRIASFGTPYRRPPDFEDFWKATKTELDQIDPQFKITLDEGLSTYFHNVYKVEWVSLGNINAYGWLSIPKPKGKYPVLIGYGGYKIPLNPLYYDDYVIFTVNVRGIDPKVYKQINPENKEQITVGLEDKDAYLYKGIYMDCVRALEFIHSHGDMGFDLGRVIAFGGSQGATLSLVTAALMPGKVNAVVANNPVFADWKNTYSIGLTKRELSFPIKNLVDYEKEHKGVKQEHILETLNYFDLQNFMPGIRCPVLYAVGLLDPFCPPGPQIAAYNKMSPAVLARSDLYIFPKLGHEVPESHQALVSIWFAEMAVKKINRK
jgi:cephalosporin-C deacetylase